MTLDQLKDKILEGRKLKHALDSEGYRGATETISSYIEKMEETMFPRRPEILGEENIRRVYPLKLYTADHAMPAIFSASGQLRVVHYEHMVFSHFQRLYEHISNYRTANDNEIDFVISDGFGNARILIQVTDAFKSQRKGQQLV